MKLGDVLKKERTRMDISVAAAAARLGLPEPDYRQLEAGRTEAERWGPLLAEVAICLETPTSRLLSPSGRSEDAKTGQCGSLIRSHRERRELKPEEMAEKLEISADQYREIEQGRSPIEKFGPLLLAFAEMIEQPIFNLFYPCGLPLDELDDYP